MFIWQQKTRIALAARKATSVLALLCLCGTFAHAEKMNSTIQEAIYEFEMKGETAKAIRLLEKVSTQGDREDRENAFFYLGKIKELAGNDASANFYYQQSLANTKETSKAYWLSEREAFTGNTYESLIKNKVPLRSSIQGRALVYPATERGHQEGPRRYDCRYARGPTGKIRRLEHRRFGPVVSGQYQGQPVF